MIEVFLVLALPVIGAALLALVGHRRYASIVNVAASVATFLAAAALTVRVIDEGPLLGQIAAAARASRSSSRRFATALVAFLLRSQSEHFLANLLTSDRVLLLLAIRRFKARLA